MSLVLNLISTVDNARSQNNRFFLSTRCLLVSVLQIRVSKIVEEPGLFTIILI